MFWYMTTVVGRVVEPHVARACVCDLCATPLPRRPLFERVVVKVELLFVVFLSLHQMAMREDFLQDKRLEQERAKSQAMLDNVMPRHVSKAMLDLKNKGIDEPTPIVHAEGSVSILFCDIIGFSDLVATVRSLSSHGPDHFSCQALVTVLLLLLLCVVCGMWLLLSCVCLLQHTPTQLVQLLDSVYSLFDMLCIKHGVTKMETVGKTFMAAAGLQGSRRNHAQALVLLGMDMIKTMATVRTKSGKQAIHVRVGINSGSVVSGLVGRKKQQFSLFGDCVNTASRMQSSGNPDEIRVSSTTLAHLGGDVNVMHQTVDVKVCFGFFLCDGSAIVPAVPTLLLASRRR